MSRREHRDRDHREKDYEEESDNQDRWLVSYADLVTLLFALFVVMYAVSSVNEVKYRILTSSVLNAFGQVAPPVQDLPKSAIGIAALPPHAKATPAEQKTPVAESAPVTSSHEEVKVLTPEDQMLQISKELSQNAKKLEVGIGKGGGLVDNGSDSLIPMSPPLNQESGGPPAEGGNEKTALPNEDKIEDVERISLQMEMDGIANDIRSALAPMINGGGVSITRSTSAIGMRIEINASALFTPADYQLNAESARALSAVARILAKTAYNVQVDGYTDTIPIKSSIFPSNWELSAARAGAVVRLFAQNGIADERLVALGHGSNDPVESNDTADGRAKNRRVSVGIYSRPAEAQATGHNSPEKRPLQISP